MTHQTENPDDIRLLAYEFFYWFSRFEFALKENCYLKKKNVGDKAEVDWADFVSNWHRSYCKTENANALFAANPKAQFVTAAGFEFTELTFSEGASYLEQVVALSKTVRNNLFHGGKAGKIYWDDPARMRELLPLVIKNLDEIAQQTGIWSDYKGEY